MSFKTHSRLFYKKILFFRTDRGFVPFSAKPKSASWFWHEKHQTRVKDIFFTLDTLLGDECLIKKRIILFLISFVLILGSIMYSVSADTNTGVARIQKGDANLDGTVSAADARYVLRVSSQLEQKLTGVAFWAADADGDALITASDARLVLRASVKLAVLDDTPYDEMSQTTAPVYVSPGSDEVTVPNNGTSSSSGSVDVIKYQNFPMPAMPDYPKTPGTFAFITYGFGHGVGMSQYGAIYLADNGCAYYDILQHYYPGTRIPSQNERGAAPQTVSLNGTAVSTREMVARITQREIAGVTKNQEALKAQAVAAYTYIKKNNFNISGVAYSSLSQVRADVFTAVDAVLGEYLADSSGRPISAVFFALSAGQTTSPQTVWGGGSDMPYLTAVASPFDRLFRGYITVQIYTVEQIRSLVAQFNAKVRSGTVKYSGEITLSNNPGEWFKVLAHDGAVSDTVGYVSQMQVGNQVIGSLAGQRLRADFFDYNLRSHCMLIEYYGNTASEADSGAVG